MSLYRPGQGPQSTRGGGYRQVGGGQSTYKGAARLGGAPTPQPVPQQVADVQPRPFYQQPTVQSGQGNADLSSLGSPMGSFQYGGLQGVTNPFMLRYLGFSPYTNNFGGTQMLPTDMGQIQSPSQWRGQMGGGGMGLPSLLRNVM